MDRCSNASGFVLRRALCVVVTAWSLTLSLHADHISGASITYSCVTGNQYTVYLDIFLDCSGAAPINQALHFSNDCGVAFDLTNLAYSSFNEVSPLCPSEIANSTCNGGMQPGFRKYRYQITLMLSPCNDWMIEWYTCCRNTMQNVNLTPGTYVVATLNNAGGICDHSPQFADNGVPYVCVNEPVSYNPGVSDADGNALSFALISARYAAPSPAPVTYINGFTGGSPVSGMNFNTANGQMYFLPNATGYYAVVFEVTSYNSLGQIIGKVMRDLMFVVVNCDGSPPTSTGVSSVTSGSGFTPVTFVACGSTQACFTIPFSDVQSSQTVTITSNATSVLPGATMNVSGTNPVIATVCWTPNQTILPVSVWFEATDNACPVANFMSTFISVVSCVFLPVELLRFTAEPAGSVVQLDWTTGSESGSASFIIERSADGIDFEPIGELAAMGHAVVETHYVFRDDAPLPGTSYYRLKEVDLDGSSTTSTTVAVDRGSLETGILASHTGTGWQLSGAPAGWSWQLFTTAGALLSDGVIGGTTGDLVPASNYTTLLVLRSPLRSYRLLLPPALDPASSGLLVRSK